MSRRAERSHRRAAGSPAVLALLLCVGSAGPALAWQFVIQGNSADYPTATVLHASGDIFVSGFGSDNEDDDLRGTLIRLEGRTGRELWRFALDSPRRIVLGPQGNPIAAGGGDRVAKHSAFTGFPLWQANLVGSYRAAAVDPSGDVIVVGSLAADVDGQPVCGQELAVAKVSGMGGGELWRWTLEKSEPGCQSAKAVAVDGSGDVIAVGGPSSTRPSGDFTVVKLSGSAGTELWTVEIDGTGSGNDVAHSVVVDATGDVIAAGHLTNSGTRRDLTVIKLSGASGGEVWRAEIDGSASGDDSWWRGTSVTLDGFGDVIAAGTLQNVETNWDFGVVKLDGTTGSELWRAAIDGGSSYRSIDAALSVTADSSGDVIASGFVDSADGAADRESLVVKLSGFDGAELWRSRMRGTHYDDRDAEASSVMAVDLGDVVVAGQLTNDKTGLDFVVTKLRGTDGVNARPTSARSFVLSEKTGSPASRRLVLASKNPGVIFRTMGANPTEEGASVEINNPATGESASLALPARNWREVRSPGRDAKVRPFRRWLYRDREQVDGPCKKVVVDRRRLRVDCRGEQIGFTLDETEGQGSLEVRLKLGADGGTEFCWLFEGDAVRSDRSTVGRRAGRFVARLAPAPVACPRP